MLSIQSSDSICDVARDLAEKGIKLNPVSGSVISNLFNASYVPSNLSTEINNKLHEFQRKLAETIEVNNKEEEDIRNNIHNQVQNECVSVVSKSIASHLSFARNVVNPIVGELANKTLEELEAYNKINITDFNILEYSPPKPYYNEKLEDLVSRFKDTKFTELDTRKITGPTSCAEINDLLSTNIPSLDADIKKWLGDVNQDWLLSIWTDAFCVKGSLQTLLTNATNGYDNALFIYLITEKFVLVGPTDGINCDLPTFNKIVAEIRKQAGAQVYRNIQDVRRTTDTKTLVKRIDTKTTFVNSDVYDEWLDNGGQVEMLLGNMLNTKRLYLGDDLVANGTKLISQWNNYYTIKRQEFLNLKFRNIQGILSKHFRSQINDARQKIKEKKPCDIETLDECLIIEKLFAQAIANVKQVDLENIYLLSLKLCCASRFSKTDAESILLNINKLAKSDEHITEREAATITTIEYINNWLISQIDISQ